MKLYQILFLIGISRFKYNDWCKRLGMPNKHSGNVPKSHWISPEEKQKVINYVKEHMPKNSFYWRDGYRRVAYEMIDKDICYLAPISVYRVLKEANLLNQWNNRKTSAKGTGFVQPKGPHKHWHTDIKYINYKGTYLFFISVLDGYSRYILHHEIRTSMTQEDVAIVIARAKEKYPEAKANLISDNGKQFIANEFQKYIKEIELQQVFISPGYPQSNGKIERFHRSLNQECLEVNSFINIDDARNTISKYVEYYNTTRLHSALGYLRPIDYLEGNPDKLYQIRESKMKSAVQERNKYWQEKYKILA